VAGEKKEAAGGGVALGTLPGTLVRIIDLLGRRPLAAFFALSYAITWPAWALEKAGLSLAAFPGYFGPAIAALVVAAATGGRDGVRDLAARLFRWRVGAGWYAAAVLFAAGPVLGAIAVWASWPGTVRAADVRGLWHLVPRLALLVVAASLYGTLVAAGEEIGWRGFALPVLLDRYSPLTASLVLGMFWGLWHLPLSFLYPSADATFVDAILYGLGVDFASVIYTWLFRNTGGSVLVASLFHAVYDACLVVLGPVAEARLGVGSILPTWVLVLGAIAGVIVVAGGREWLTLPPGGGK
jgi:membrane protease YdiL (CAAX protease family)